MLSFDPNSVDLSKLDRQQIRQLQSSVVQDLAASTGQDILTVWPKARNMYAKLWATSDALPLPPDGAPIVPGLDGAKAPPLAIPSVDNIDAMGLCRDCTLEEFNTVWRACGNCADRTKADKAFDALRRGHALGRTGRESNVWNHPAV
jgi:hypothetical protein